MNAHAASDSNAATDDERVFREFMVTNRKYFPFEGGYEEKFTAVTTRTYLDGPDNEPPLVIRTTKQVATTVLREEVHGDVYGSDDEDSDNDSSNDDIDADRSAAADDKRVFREFTVTNRKYFPFEGGYEEKFTAVTTRTYLDGPDNEPPLVIRTTKHVVTTVLREEVHGDVYGSDDEDSDNDSSNDDIDADRSASSDLESDVEMFAPARQAPARQGHVNMKAPAHQAPAQRAHVNMDAPAHQAPARKADVDMNAPPARKIRAIVINTDSDDPDSKAKTAALRASAPYPMFRPYPEAPSENIVRPTGAAAAAATISRAPDVPAHVAIATTPAVPITPALRASIVNPDRDSAERFRIIDSFFQTRNPTAGTSSAGPSSVAGGSGAAGTSRAVGGSRMSSSSAATKIRPKKAPLIGPKNKPIITDFDIDDDGAIVISD